MKNIYKNPLFYLSVVLIIAVGFTVFNLVKAFQEPTEPFPGSDVAAPIDESSAPQIKEGNLALGALCLRSSFGASFECRYYWDTIISSRHFKTDFKGVYKKGGDKHAYSYAWCEPDEVRTGGGCSVGRAHLLENHPVYSSGARKGGWYCEIDKDWTVNAWVVCVK